MAEDLGKSFESLPIGHLICTPIVEVARGQAELCRVYLDYLFSLAFKNGNPEEGINSIKFTIQRQIVSPEGDTQLQPIEVEAPLLALVPVPAFTMEEATVRFTMEVKDVKTDKSKNASSLDTTAGFSKWGFHASVTGKVATSHENTRTSDKSAKYELYARACQQEPAEGMAKLTSILASVMEPIESKGS